MSTKRGDKYFSENKAYVGLGRASLHSGVIFIAARGVNVFVQLASTILLAAVISGAAALMTPSTRCAQPELREYARARRHPAGVRRSRSRPQPRVYQR